MPRILRRHLLIKVCSFDTISSVILDSFLTLELKILILVVVVISLDLQMLARA